MAILSLNAQTIQVLNTKTGQPIDGVLIYTEKFSTQTDQSGKAKIDNFTSDDRILFKHSSYINFHSTKGKIEKQGKIVWLIEDPIRLDEIVISANHCRFGEQRRCFCSEKPNGWRESDDKGIFGKPHFACG